MTNRQIVSNRCSAVIASLLLVGCGKFSSPTNGSENSLSGPKPSVTPSPNPTPSPTPFAGNTLKVCPAGCSYTLPSAANNVAKAGDLILIEPGTYVDCFVVKVNNLTVRGNVDPNQGIKGLPILKNKTCAKKGIIVNESFDNLTVENLEFSGMAVADFNGSAIRHQGHGLTVRNIYAHDGEEGILIGGTSPQLDRVLIENSVFTRCGSSGHQGYEHNLYVGAVGEVQFKNSISIEARFQGHEFKSRALSTIIDCSVLAGFDGIDSYTIDIPQGGDAVIKNSIIQQGPMSSNKGFMSLSIEPILNPGRNVTFDSNTIINDASTGTFFNLDPSVQLRLLNNDIVGPGSLIYGKAGGPNGGNPIQDTSAKFSNRSVYATAKGVALPDYSAGQVLPPLPSSCAPIHPKRCASLTDYLKEIRFGTPCP